jgi:hypothetical protein
VSSKINGTELPKDSIKPSTSQKQDDCLLATH